MLKNVILGRGIQNEEHGRELIEELKRSGLRVFVAEDGDYGRFACNTLHEGSKTTGRIAAENEGDSLEAAKTWEYCAVSETAVLENDLAAAKGAEKLYAATAVYCPEEGELDKVDFVDFIVTSLEGIDESFFRLLYCRSFRLPLEIARTRELVIREYVPADSFAYYELMKSVPADTIRDVPLETFESFDEWFKAYIGWKYRFYDYGYWGVYKRGDICEPTDSKDAYSIAANEGQQGKALRLEGPSEGEQLVASVGLEVAERMIGGEKRVINELGYLVGGPFQHRGYGLQMLEAVIKYGKQQLGMEQVCCLIEKGNMPSRRLLERVAENMGLELTISDADEQMLLFEF